PARAAVETQVDALRASLPAGVTLDVQDRQRALRLIIGGMPAEVDEAVRLAGRVLAAARGANGVASARIAVGDLGGGATDALPDEAELTLALDDHADARDV